MHHAGSEQLSDATQRRDKDGHVGSWITPKNMISIGDDGNKVKITFALSVEQVSAIDLAPLRPYVRSPFISS